MNNHSSINENKHAVVIAIVAINYQWSRRPCVSMTLISYSKPVDTGFFTKCCYRAATPILFISFDVVRYHKHYTTLPELAVM
jgi:hypothetical protein